VAKTTLSINAAGAAAAAGYQTLLIDLDPQGYLTNGVGIENEYTAESTTMYDALRSPTEYDLSTLTVSNPEFDVVPANIDMFSLDQELVSEMQGWLRIQMLLDSGIDQYDFVITDCPPS
jgi:chromosome partitioning protein